MDNLNTKNPEPERPLASLSPELMDRLAELVVAKLKAAGLSFLPSKQVVAGQNPVSRSIVSLKM